jgi:hypothetical protein
LKTNDGEPEILVWLLTFFAGEVQEQEFEDYIEKPALGLIKAAPTFQMVWRDVLLSTDLTEQVITAIKDRMVTFAVKKYEKQDNQKKDEMNLSLKEKHNVITAFKSKYHDIFMIWTTQLLKNYAERKKYIQTLQGKLTFIVTY